METASDLTDRLAAGDVIMIDAGTGTELERKGAEMIAGAWSGAAALTHADVLTEVHQDHLAAGAEVVVANTYASSRHILAQVGREHEFEELNRVGIELAAAARDAAVADGRPRALVAGSISTTDQGGERPAIEVARANYVDQAQIQVDAGAELFMLEMMRDIDHTRAVLDAVTPHGLPVWLGMSALEKDGEPWLPWAEDRLDDALRVLLADYTPDLVAIMHTEVALIDECLDILDRYWDGPVGVYAQTGEFRPPNWVFTDTITAEDYADACLRWVDRGVQVIGGCCGITPEHLVHLRTVLPTTID